MFLLLFGVWLILNGKVTVEICIFGLVIASALFVFMCKFMDYSLRKERLLLSLIPFFIKYLWALIVEIVKANIAVLKISMSPDIQPEPALLYFETDLKTELARVMLANSITLTPGTITVSLEGNRYCVHCLDRELADDPENSIFVKLLKEMEEKEARIK